MEAGCPGVVGFGDLGWRVGGWPVAGGTARASCTVAGSRPGVIGLLPLLERPTAEVTAGLGVGRLDGHGLGFEAVVDAALAWRASGYWTERAIAWLDAGFPAAGYEGALRRLLSDKRLSQRARQTAARVLVREFPGPVQPG